MLPCFYNFSYSEAAERLGLLNIVKRNYYSLRYNLIFIFVFVVGLAIYIKNYTIKENKTRILVFMFVWLMADICGGVIGKFGFHHYFFPAQIPMVVGFWILFIYLKSEGLPALLRSLIMILSFVPIFFYFRELCFLIVYLFLLIKKDIQFYSLLWFADFNFAVNYLNIFKYWILVILILGLIYWIIGSLLSLFFSPDNKCNSLVSFYDRFGAFYRFIPNLSTV